MPSHRSRLLIVALLMVPLLEATAQVPDFVTATYSLDQAYALVTLNGFPILNDSTESSLSGGGPVNLHLVPTDNRLEVRFEPFMTHSDDEVPSMTFSLGTTSEGDIVDTNNEGSLVNVSLDAKGGPQTIVETFDLPEAWRGDFRAGRIYSEAEVITDEAALRAYALKLFEWIESGDYAAFAREALPRMRAYRDAFKQSGLPPDDPGLEKAFVNSIEPALEAMILHTDVHEGNVKLVPWADGRVWEVRLDDGKALIYATDGDGGALSLDLFVANVDGALRIVR